MTWQEFKIEVERQLKEKKIPIEIPIFYIDVIFPTDTNIIVTYTEDENDIKISTSI